MVQRDTAAAALNAPDWLLPQGHSAPVVGEADVVWPLVPVGERPQIGRNTGLMACSAVSNRRQRLQGLGAKLTAGASAVIHLAGDMISGPLCQLYHDDEDDHGGQHDPRLEAHVTVAYG